MSRIVTYVLILLLSSNTALFGQACCSGGVPISSNLGLSSGQKQSWQFLLTYDFNSMNDLIDNSSLLVDDTRRRATHSNLFEVNYGLTEKITLTGMVSIIRQERTIKTISEKKDFTYTQGLGDGAILLKYQLSSNDVDAKSQLLVGAGPKIPIGRTNFKNNIGLSLPADMQPGSGAWDVILWSYFSRAGFIWPNFSLTATSIYRYTGTNRHYNETQFYRFGNEFQFNLGFNNRFVVGTMLMDAMLVFRYRNQTADLVDEEKFPSSGGQWVYVVPGININFSPDFSLRLSGDIPIYRKLDGTQLTTSYKTTAAIYYTFSRKPKTDIIPTTLKTKN
ncbi:hypothetical protein JYU20_02965 [Bacteroidales bacterium AH-315-I05]|nr:hypothetical protein [Bacteroidales bacterium AH-315-I05]